MTIGREEELYGMSKERIEYLQCMYCGKIHRQKIQCRDDDLYIYEKCKSCGKVVKHLRCGENPDDIYMYYDYTMDFRFYDYKTK